MAQVTVLVSREVARGRLGRVAGILTPGPALKRRWGSVIGELNVRWSGRVALTVRIIGMERLIGRSLSRGPLVQSAGRFIGVCPLVVGRVAIWLR